MMLATICICAIFYPFLLTLTGALLDALMDFPWTITINLMVSLMLVVTVIPFLCVTVIGTPSTEKEGKRLTDRVQAIYDRVLAKTFRHPWLTICHMPGRHRRLAAHPPHAEDTSLPLRRPRPIRR